MARRLPIAWAALAAALAAAPAATAQEMPEVYLHGSFENQLTALWTHLYDGGERLSVYDANRLRVDVDADLPGGLELRSDVVARLFVGETDLYVANLLPRRAIDELIARDPRWSSALRERYRLADELRLDNAYLRIPIGRAVATVGKQPLEQGAGYAWNPTDPFTTKDMFDPTYEKPGVISARVRIPIADRASLDLIGAPDGSVERWSAGGRAALHLGPVTVCAVSYVTRVRRTRLEASMDAMLAAAARGEDPDGAIQRVDSRRVLVGGDLVADVGGVRLWAEGAYNFVEDERGAQPDWWELVGGAEYYFPFETHLMVEYLHYGASPPKRGATYGFDAWMRVLDTELKMLGADFLFETVDHPVADYWTVGLSSFQSLSDGSATVMADVRWQFVQDAELWLLLAGNVGERTDFLSSTGGQGWLRLKVFF